MYMKKIHHDIYFTNEIKKQKMKRGNTMHNKKKQKKSPIDLIGLKNKDWWAIRDSNPRHSRCKRDALTN